MSDDLEQPDVEQPARFRGGGSYLKNNGGVPLDHPRRCQANRANGKGPCRRFAIKGGIVCRVHGGAAEQVQRAAQTRLKLAADRMAAHILQLAEEAKSEHVQYLATTAALDRAGVVEPKQVNVDVNAPWAEIMGSITGIAAISQAESRRRRGLPALSAPDNGNIVDAEVVEEPPSGPPNAQNRPAWGQEPPVPGTGLQTMEEALEDLRQMRKPRW